MQNILLQLPSFSFNSRISALRNCLQSNFTLFLSHHTFELLTEHFFGLEEIYLLSIVEDFDIWSFSSDKMPNRITNCLSWLISSAIAWNIDMHISQNLRSGPSCFHPSGSRTHATVVAFVLGFGYFDGEKISSKDPKLVQLTVPSWLTLESLGWWPYTQLRRLSYLVFSILRSFILPESSLRQYISRDLSSRASCEHRTSIWSSCPHARCNWCAVLGS